LDVANDDYGVTWASLEAPLVTFNAPANKWVDGVNNDNATFLSYIMTNVWITNYKAGQSGDFTFRYSLTTHDGPTDRLAATRFGAEWTTPLLACILPKDQRGALPADQHSFLTVNGDGVVLQAFKRAEDARGVIVRLRSVADADSQARIRMADCPFKQAALTDIVERDQQRLVIDDDEVVAVPVRAGGMATIRLW
jgi:alpha-mannosidase